MTDANDPEREQEKRDHGVPPALPPEEGATGWPTDDRLQSEVPQPGNDKPGNDKPGDDQPGDDRSGDDRT